MVVYGYARVSTAAQELEAQIQMLEKNGAFVIYQEKFTGTKTDRPELNHLLSRGRYFNGYEVRPYCSFSNTRE